jgi:hypothetical protein
MSSEKVKASKVKVHSAPEGSSGLDGRFHVYVYDVFNKKFLEGKAFDTLERAASFVRHMQERIYLEQEADPELFDLPFVSNDSGLIERASRDEGYRKQLVTDLDAEARHRARRR